MSTLTGGCLCGLVRYAYEGALGPASICHCKDCRKMSGSAFGVSVRLSKDGFRLLKQPAKGFDMRAESGHELTRYFCAECGSPIYTSSPAHSEHFYVEAGSLDEPDAIQLSHQSWISSAVDWARIPPDLPSFEKNRP